MIKLTLLYNQFIKEHMNYVHVNPKYIKYIQCRLDNTGSCVYVENIKDPFIVKETPEEIVAMINKE